ncbi:carboxyl transferase domain-containing protein, partial [Paucilactobacillus nenjiangensis]|uniref:carboxyl transferase domain-containing protein n=1 Tax=Paucilactobacillus nenjiangensis TaxID=1296540 RepID=UPI003BB1736A
MGTVFTKVKDGVGTVFTVAGRNLRTRMSGTTKVPPMANLHTTAGKLADLGDRIDKAVHAASAQSVDKQHARGKMTARERILALLDEGTFTEMDEFGRHRSTQFGMEKRRPYGDGVIIGVGAIHERPVCVFSQDVGIF